MRFGPPDEVLSGSCEWSCVVSSWKGGIILAAEVPVLRGRLASKVEAQGVTERLTITVPRWDGRDWLPGSTAEHPLARYGQELYVSIVVTSAVSGSSWTTPLGRFLITDWDDDDAGTVSVTASSRLRRVADDRLTSPLQPRDTGTLVSEARRLLPVGMSAAFDAGLVDRTCPAGMSWPDDRLTALQEIADAWPARLRVDEWGQVRFRAPLPVAPAPVVTLKDGARGTLQSAPRSDTRTGAYNRVVARSSASGQEDVQAVASQQSGPMSVTGDYGVVTRIWSSPLLESYAQALASAATMLRSSILPTQTLPVTCAPDPRVELDDAVDVVRDAGTPLESHTWGWVTGVDIPLTVADGGMRVDVGVAS